MSANGFTGQVAVDNRRMDVALPADGRGVAQDFRDRGDRRLNFGRRPFHSLKVFQLPQGDGGEDRARPSAKIFCRDVGVTDLTEILIHVI